MHSNYSMSTSQLKAFQEALDIYEETIELSRKLRKESFNNKQSLMIAFNHASQRYKVLLNLMRELVKDSDGDLRIFFNSKYECFSCDYRLLKAITSDLIKHNSDTYQLRAGFEQRILTEYVTSIVKYEQSHIQMISDQKEELIIKYFTGLAEQHIKTFRYLSDIFNTALKTKNFNFYFSPFIRLPWSVLTIVNKKERKEWKAFTGRYNQISRILSTFNSVSNHNQLADSIPMNKFVFRFGECIQRLAKFSASEDTKEIESKKQRMVLELNELGKGSGVVDYFTKALKSTPEIEYRETEKNRSLIGISSMVREVLGALSLLVDNLKVVGQDVYQLAYFFKFLKSYVLSYIYFEIYRRISLYTNVKKKLSLLKV